MKYIVHTDGGARGNPGPAAIGVVIGQQDDNRTPVTAAEYGKVIGETTNNVAEYTAVIDALETLASLVTEKERGVVEFYLDSLLVVNQLNGLFKVKEPRLRELLMEVRIRERQVNADITYQAVRREQNTRADYFVNLALDTAGK